jgi:tRNA pseudouridine32 synthase/23S rRNA pseudouridine746 synthase
MVEPDQPELIYIDESILVIDKPAGLLSLQDGFAITLPHLQTILEPVYGRLWMVHRLDRDTSGVMVIARSAQAHRELNRQFKERLVSKQYLLLVHGNPCWEDTWVKAPLRKDGDREHRTVVDLERGKPAQTEFRRLAVYSRFCLLNAFPHTGYTHQIRVHIASIGFPIVHDQLYQRKFGFHPGDTECDLPINRIALHAQSISFTHPVTQQPFTFSAPEPLDYQQTIAILFTTQNL